MTLTSVTSWNSILDQVAEKFPFVDCALLRSQTGDMGALIMLVAERHDLTFAEAAEVVAFRLPQYVEPERLTA